MLIVHRLAALLALPILARSFGVAEYGTYDALMNLANLFATFIILGQDSAVARFIYDYDDVERRKLVISQSFFLQLILVVGIMPLLLLLGDQIVGLYLGDREFSREAFYLSLAYVPFVVVISSCANLLKWTFSRRKFAILLIGDFCGNLSLTVIFVVALGMGVSGVFLALLINGFVFSVLALSLCRPWLVIPTNLSLIGPLFRLGVPYGVVSILGAAVPVVDRAIVGRLLGLEALGFYAVAYRVAGIINMPIAAFNTAWGPISLSLHKQHNAATTYNQVFVLFAWGVVAVALGLGLFMEELVVLLASDRFRDAHWVAYPILIGLAVNALGRFAGIGSDLAKRSDNILYSYGVFFLIFVSCSFYLVSEVGVLGASLGVMAGLIVGGALYIILAYRVHPLRFELLVPVIVILLGLIVGGGLIYYDSFFQDWRWSVRIVAVVVILFAGWKYLARE